MYYTGWMYRDEASYGFVIRWQVVSGIFEVKNVVDEGKCSTWLAAGKALAEAMTRITKG